MKPTRTAIQLWITLVLALGLVIAPGAQPAATQLLHLGPIAVANGVASVSGTVASNAGNNTVTVNGQPVGVDASGVFQASVPLNRASTVTVGLKEAGSTEQNTFEIPLTDVLLGQGGVIPAGALDSLEQAGLSLLTPVTGAPGQPLTVGGSVLDRTQLSSLSVNGKDVLGALTSDGTFSVQVPGTTKVVTVKATDVNGNSQTKVIAVKATTVSAANAVGLRITKVRYYKQAALRTHRLRMIVTVRDRRGLLVRGAKITVRPAKAGRLVRKPKTSKSGRKGQATFVLRLRAAAFGKRLVVVTLARTPRATVSRKTAVLVPRRKHR